MEADVRACVAYVAWRLISGMDASAIFDRNLGRSSNLSGTVGPDSVRIYNFGEHCYFGGLFNGVQFNLWHGARNHFVDLKIEGNSFRGYDYGFRDHFHGEVRGGGIMICDRQLNSYFHYLM